MTQHDSQPAGQQLLTAIDRILASNDAIREVVRSLDQRPGQVPLTPKPTYAAARREALADLVVRHYATKAAISGGATSVAGLLPVVGGVVAATGGTLADMAYMMKYEIEMALALAHVYGFDIDREQERQIAYLLASIGMYGVATSRDAMRDLLAAEKSAIFAYAPRELAKLTVKALSQVAVVLASKSLVKAVPFVGMVVSAGFNKAATARVGARIKAELSQRSARAPARGELPAMA